MLKNINKFTIRKLIKDLIGIWIESNKENIDKRLDILEIINNQSINHFLDIGANKGQFYKMLLRAGLKIENYTFIEPQKECFNDLKKIKDTNNNINIDICINGISDSKSSKILNVTKNSASSTIIESKKFDEKFVNATGGKEKEYEIETITLSHLIENFTTDDSKLFLKVDVQGAELDVLKGLKNSHLNRIGGLLIETSLCKNIYGLPATTEKCIEWCLSKNLNLRSIYPGFKYKNESIMECDLLFINKS